jgi:hypothetical protein
MTDPFLSRWIGNVAASDEHAPRLVPALWHSTKGDRGKTVFCKLSEARLIRAYLALFLIPWQDGARSVRLARFGAYEVRLVEFEHDCLSGEGFPLWLELFAHDIQMSIDSRGCDEFDEAVGAADELIAKASELYRSRQQ